MSETVETNTPDESKRINSKELAHYMGYAGKKDTEKAIKASKLGRLAEANAAFSDAEQAEKQGAQEYVQDSHRALDDDEERILNKRAELDGIAEEYRIETTTTPEMEQKIKAARTELAKKYEQYGAKLEDFRLVSFEREGKPVHVVMYAAPSGIDLGDSKNDHDERRSYDAIMSDRQAHTIEIDGKEYDTRTGMTIAAYKAFIEDYTAFILGMKEEDASVLSGELPDTTKSRREDLRTYTLITGEENPNSALVAYMGGGSIRWYNVARSGDETLLIRFRPAVELQL